jgi:hypothetical protein
MQDQALPAIIMVLGEKVVEQSREITMLQEKIDEDQETRYRMAERIAHLEKVAEQCEADRSRWYSRYCDMTNMNRDNVCLADSGVGPSERAERFMKSEGSVMWQDGKKIEVMRRVKAITGWGLRDTKDFCEKTMGYVPIATIIQSAYDQCEPARLDTEGTAKPLTEIRATHNADETITPGFNAIAYKYQDRDDEIEVHTGMRGED